MSRSGPFDEHHRALGVKSASDLAIAAAARLTFGKKQDKFTRREIGAEMKGATTFYKKNMASNLSTSLATLVNGNRLNQIEKDVYALTANERTTLEVKFAQPI
jgi:hypothetical protein